MRRLGTPEVKRAARAARASFLPVWFLLVAVRSLVLGAPAVDTFDAANKLYDQGKFAEAASAYGELTGAGQVSPAVYFNLGNALFKSGQIGRAIAAYRQAEALAPRDPDVRANLQFARNQVHGPTLLPGRLERWLDRLTLNEWTFLALGSLWLVLLLKAVLQLRPAIKPALRTTVWGAGAITFLFSGCLAAALYHSHNSETAIVIAADSAVRIGPLEEASTAFVAHDGAELRVLDRKDNWLQVSAGPRRVGWLRRDQVTWLPN